MSKPLLNDEQAVVRVLAKLAMSAAKVGMFDDKQIRIDAQIELQSE